MTTEEAFMTPPAWVNRLPEPYKEHAIEAWLVVRKDGKWWTDTVEGLDYWASVQRFFDLKMSNEQPDPHPSWKPKQINGIDL